MKYALVRNGIVENIVVGEGLDGDFIPCSPVVGIGWTYNNGTFQPPIQVKVWTSYEFLNRLTASERADIRQRALTDPNVADFLMLATAAQEVRSDDPVTIIGMDYMVLIGVFTQSRRDEILGVTNGS